MENSRITAGLRGFAAGLFLALVLLAVLVWLLEPPALAHAAGANRAFAALLIRSGAPQDGEEHEVEGLLISAPPGGVIGEWVVQSEQNMTHTLLVDAATRIDEGIPTVGSWVKARYIVQVDGTWLATRLRPDEYEAGEIVVRLASAALSGTLASQYGLSPVRTLLSSGHIYLFRTADDDEDVVALAEQLLADPAVIWAEPNFVGGAPEGNPYKVWHWGGLDPANYTNQFAFAQINLAAALEQASGAGVIVAVLDTGIDRNHPVFTNRLLAGWDMVADDADPQEESNGLAWGHGTHVAGIIAHLAPDSELLPVRVLDANGLGNTFTLAYAIEWAVHQGADVINLSLGAEANSHVLQTAIQYALEQGVVVVAAVGNNDSDHPFYPVAYPGVIGVTAVDAANHKAPFANYGASFVDLAAPGVGITSTIIGPEGSGYASWSGTSMSTAFVSGAAALLQQKVPGASVTTTLELLRTHGADLDPANPAYVGQIGRMLDLATVLRDAATATPSPTVTPTLTATPPPTVGTPAPTVTPSPVATPVGGGERSRHYLPLVLR